MGSRLLAKAGRLCGEVVGTVVATSPEVRRALLDEHWVPPGKTIVIPHGVNIERFSDPGRRGPARVLWGVPEEAPLVGAVLQTEDPGERELLRAVFEAVQRRVPEARFVCCGLRGELGPSQGLGPYADSPAFYAAIDVLCVPRVSAVVPPALLEGLAAGVPVVGCESPGRDGGGPESAPGEPWAYARRAAAEPEALGELLAEQLREPEAARARSAEGRACVEARHSIESVVERVQRLYGSS